MIHSEALHIRQELAPGFASWSVLLAAYAHSPFLLRVNSEALLARLHAPRSGVIGQVSVLCRLSINSSHTHSLVLRHLSCFGGSARSLSTAAATCVLHRSEVGQVLLSFARTRCDSPRLVRWPHCLLHLELPWLLPTSSLVFTAPMWTTYCLVIPVCVVRAQAPAAKTFFNRAEELNCLERLLSSPPRTTGITVIVGPPSCGKTALVEHFLDRQNQPQPPLYVDCRVQAVHTPGSLASTLLSSTESAGERIVDLAVASAKVLFGGFSKKWVHNDETIELKLSSLTGLIADLKARQRAHR